MKEPTILRLQASSPYLPMVASWTFGAWGHWHPNMDIDRWAADVAADCGPAGVPSVFVAEWQGRPVGTASLIADDMESRPDLTPWLASVFVLAECRERGVGSALVRRVEQEARGAGVERFYLFTPDRQAYYRRRGWCDFQEEVHRGTPVTVMCRRLDPLGA